MANRGLCKYCRQPVIWVLSEGGKRMPLNPLPVADGNVVAYTTSKGMRARVLTSAMAVEVQYSNVHRFVHHAVTCANRPGARPGNRRSSSDESGSAS